MPPPAAFRPAAFQGELGSLVLLCRLGVLIKAERRQAFASSPVVESGLLVAFESARGSLAHPGLSVDLQRPVEQAGDQYA